MDEYTILVASDASTLSSQVNNLLKNDWKPQGGIAISEILDPESGEISEQWAQAMIKEN